MRSVIISGVAAAGLLGLSACGDQTKSKTEAPAAVSAGDASASAASNPTAATQALDAPRPGLWRVATTMKGLPGVVAIAPQDICVKEARLEAPSAGKVEGADCNVPTFARQGDAMQATSVCTLPGGVKATSTIRMTGDFTHRYVTEVTTTMDPAPLPAMAQTTMTLTAERIGDC